MTGSFTCYSQFRYSGQSSIGFNGGGATDGYFIDANYQLILNDQGSMIRADLDYTEKKREIEALATDFNTNIISLGVAYGYLFNEIFGQYTFFHLWLGGFGSKETYDFNKNYEHMIDGNTNDPFTYGLYGGIEAELHLTSNISLIATYSRWQNLKSDFAKNTNKLGGGLKIYFN
ncbi:hypothetical protein [Sinomicrobium sp. M5D2P9]